MGLFDNLFQSGQNSQLPQDSIRYSSEQMAFIAVLMACNDNPLAIYEDDPDDDYNPETEMIVRIAMTKPFLRSVRSVEALEEYSRIKRIFDSKKALEIAVSQLSEENKKSAFIHCFDIIFANLNVDAREKQFMEYLAETMKLDKAFVANISEIITLKYL